MDRNLGPIIDSPLGSGTAALSGNVRQRPDPPDFVPGLDELARKLDMAPAEECGVGFMMKAESGATYGLVELMAAFIRFVQERV